MTCAHCRGAGRVKALLIFSRRCAACDGSGWIAGDRANELIAVALGEVRKSGGFSDHASSSRTRDDEER